MIFDWIDITTYSKSDKERVPSILMIDRSRTCGFEVKIHRHRYYENTWLLSCYDLGITDFDLETNEFEEAEKKAINKLVSKLVNYTAFYNLLKLQQK